MSAPYMLPFLSPPKASPPNWIWQLREGGKEIGDEGRSLSPRDSWNIFAARHTAPLRFFPIHSASPARAEFLPGSSRSVADFTFVLI
jgi:hypothetical protein